MWIAKLKDGTIVTQEDGRIFAELKDVVGLSYKYRDVIVGLPDNMDSYRFGGSASYSVGSGNLEIESYWIEGSQNSRRTRIRFRNLTNKVEIETLLPNG
jgi:hypothetical protein